VDRQAAPRGGDAQPVGDILSRLLRASGLKEKLRHPEIYDCWAEVAGAEASRHSRVVGFSHCVLHVEVDSAPWLQMLSTFGKKELLNGVRIAMPGVRVRDIRFRIGRSADSITELSERNPWQQKTPPTTPATSRSYPA